MAFKIPFWSINTDYVLVCTLSDQNMFTFHLCSTLTVKVINNVCDLTWLRNLVKIGDAILVLLCLLHQSNQLYPHSSLSLSLLLLLSLSPPQEVKKSFPSSSLMKSFSPFSPQVLIAKQAIPTSSLFLLFIWIYVRLSLFQSVPLFFDESFSNIAHKRQSSLGGGKRNFACGKKPGRPTTISKKGLQVPSSFFQRAEKRTCNWKWLLKPVATVSHPSTHVGTSTRFPLTLDWDKVGGKKTDDCIEIHLIPSTVVLRGSLLYCASTVAAPLIGFRKPIPSFSSISLSLYGMSSSSFSSFGWVHWLSWLIPGTRTYRYSLSFLLLLHFICIYPILASKGNMYG